jgi:hypothetical protein
VEKRKTERRKVNQAVGDERRGSAKDRRSCPQCGSTVRSHSRSILGGSITHRYCSKCHWKAVSRQVDEETLVELAGLEAEVVGTAQRPMLQLNANFLKAAKLKIGGHVRLKPIYTPGAQAQLQWILKKMG